MVLSRISPYRKDMSDRYSGASVSEEPIWVYQIPYANCHHSSEIDELCCTFRCSVRDDKNSKHGLANSFRIADCKQFAELRAYQLKAKEAKQEEKK
jgi:hypothetical protein